MLFLHVTTRIPGRAHDDLLSVKGGRFFPTFMVLDPKGGALAKKPGALDIAAMNQLVDGAKKRREAFVALEKKAAEGDEKAKAKLSVWELELTHITLAEFRKRYPDLSKLDEDLRGAVLDFWGDQAVAEAGAIFNRVAGKDKSKWPEAGKAAAPQLLEAAKAGAEPTDERSRRSFFLMLGIGGEALGNAEMLKLAIAGLEDEVEANAQVGRFVEGWKKKLEELEAAAKGM